MYRPISASSIHIESSEGKFKSEQISYFVMLLEAIHVGLWATYAVVVNVHFILVMLVKVLFQYQLQQTL